MRFILITRQIEYRSVGTARENHTHAIPVLNAVL